MGHQEDQLLGLARQLAASSVLANRTLDSLRFQNKGLESAIQAVAQMNRLNDAVLASTKRLLFSPTELRAADSYLKSLVSTNQSFLRVVDQITLPNSVIGSALITEAAVAKLSVGADLEIGQSAAAALAKLDTSAMVAASLVAQQKMGLIGRQKVGQLLRADTTFRRSIGAHTGRMTRSYAAVMGATESRLAHPSETVLATSFPPIDYYRHMDLLESITMPSADSASEESVDQSLARSQNTIDDVLSLFDPALCPLLAGARRAVDSDNPESPRHVVTSLRELLTHVLGRLAPDLRIQSWSSNPSDYHQGRPTRRARMLFICRNINSGSLVEFVDADVSAALALIDSLNKSTHVVESDLTQGQLRSIVSRVESLLLFILGLPRD